MEKGIFVPKHHVPLSPRLGEGLEEQKVDLGRGNSPYINQGKGDTLAQKSHEPPPPQRYKEEKANGDLEGYWRHPAPEPG
eukprot:1160798-Pelagomonas_calceolata.AAC.7